MYEQDKFHDLSSLVWKITSGSDNLSHLFILTHIFFRFDLAVSRIQAVRKVFMVARAEEIRRFFDVADIEILRKLYFKSLVQ